MCFAAAAALTLAPALAGFFSLQVLLFTPPPHSDLLPVPLMSQEFHATDTNRYYAQGEQVNTG